MLLHPCPSCSADHMQYLHSLLQLDNGVDLSALHRCLEVSNNIYRFMVT